VSRLVGAYTVQERKPVKTPRKKSKFRGLGCLLFVLLATFLVATTWGLGYKAAEAIWVAVR
jgi:hypothetical protein